MIYVSGACAFISKYLSYDKLEYCSNAKVIATALVLIGTTVIFVGCAIIQNAALAVISKSSTSKLNRNPVNCGILKSTALLVGKMFGNLGLLLIWMSYCLSGLDFMNFIAFSFLTLLVLGYLRVKKNYFFLNS